MAAIARPGRVRAALVVAHRWVGLLLALPLLISAATGLALVFARDIDERLAPHLFRVEPQPGAVALAQIHREAQQRYGSGSRFTVRLPRAPGASAVVHVDGAWAGQAYFDPHSGRWLGQRGETEGWFNWLFELHSTLLLGDSGRALLAASAGASVALLLSGAWLWWPTRRHPLRIRWSASRPALVFDLHRVAGFLFGALVLVALATGAWMAWRPLSAGVSALVGDTPVRPPAVTHSGAAPRAAPDRLLRAAEAALPDGTVSFVQIPADPTHAVRVRMRLPDEAHPNGISSVWLDPASAQVLRTLRWTEFDAGARAYVWIYPLHSGALFGAANRAALAVAALALAAFVTTGGLLWYRRTIRP